ncbi:MAG TPA: UDP-N-acetylglucosamine 1-carboxyvinyltransferase [Candidatus Nanoarchaeia archaeon]
MAKYVIEGGVPLRGSVRIPGAKNAGFKLMIASLLSDEMSTLSNIPYIRDVVAVKKIIEALGSKVEFSDDTMQICCKLSRWEVPEELGVKSRASFMYLPVLLHRFKKGKVYLPVGDRIGNRPIDWFLEGLERMGAKIKFEDSEILASSPRGLMGCDYTFPKNSHTGTEALIIAACLAKGKTRFENAAAEPEVDELIAFLNKMGAKIKRVKSREIEITGVNSLRGTVHKVMPDRNEAATFSCMALGTKGEVEIENVKIKDIQAFVGQVRSTGGGIKPNDNKLIVFYKNTLKPTNIQTASYPGFMTDWQSLWAALMTQADGESIIHETIFESRFSYARYLINMGAKIELFSPGVKSPEEAYNFEWNEETALLPHAAKVFGPRQLHGSKLEVSDIRAGATLVFAALMADGKSEITGIEHIERGYEDLEGRLEKLGARISRVD